MSSSPKEHGAGFIVISDIVDFSKLAIVEQKRLVKKLWDFTADHPLIHDNKDGFGYNSTGDGMLVTVPYAASQFSAVVQYCIDLIKHMRSSPSFCEVRLGVHIGPFEEFRYGKLPGPDVDFRMLIGTGCNTCARVSGIGDANCVVLSEEFVQAWKHVAGNLPFKLKPAAEKDPIEVRVKHGVPQCVRLVDHKDCSQKLPRKIRLLSEIENRIRALLQEIEREFLLQILVEQHHDDIAEDDFSSNFSEKFKSLGQGMSTRVSLFGLSSERKRVLEPTEFRWNHRKEALSRSKVVYPIRCKVDSPISHAFKSGKPAFVNQLPDPEDDFDGYQIALGRAGISERLSGLWQRHPRALMAVPFGLVGSKAGNSGIICIDCSQPIPLDDDGVQCVGSSLLQRFSPELGALWRLRL